MDRNTLSKIQNYLRTSLGSKQLKIEGRENKIDSADVTLNGEFLGVIFEDKEANEKKSYFEIVYAVVVKIDDDVKDKKDLEKIILCEVPDTVYPELEKVFLNLVHDSGFPGLKFEKKVDFNKLFSERFN